MFLQLFAPLVLVILYNPSIRKLVFHRSRGINFNTFCGCFFDFISSVVFDHVFLTFGGNLGLHLASIFKKKRFRKWLRKKGPHTSKQHPMNRSGGSQGGRLACALLKQETRVRAQVPGIVARTRFFGCFLKMLFQFVSISDLLKTSSRKFGKMSRAHSPWSDTPSAKAWRISKFMLGEIVDH